MSKWIAVMSVVSALLMVACGSKHQTSECTELNLKASAKGDVAALIATGEAAWKERKDPVQLKKAVDAWAKAIAADPKRADLRVKLARARYLYADAHLRSQETDEAEAEMMNQFSQGVTDAETALRQLSSPYHEGRCKQEVGVADAIKKVDKAAVPAMYWYATNLGKWGLEKGLFTILKYKDDIKAMQDRIIELQPGYFYHAPYRYLGVYHIKVPPLVGAPEKSKPNFAKAVKESPEYLETKVLYAGYYATKVKNRQLFRELLKDVADYDLAATPELEAENIIGKRRAATLLEDIDDYFGEPDEAQQALDKKADAARAAAKAAVKAAADKAVADKAAAEKAAADKAAAEKVAADKAAEAAAAAAAESKSKSKSKRRRKRRKK